jgi:hypothetical protein
MKMDSELRLRLDGGVGDDTVWAKLAHIEDEEAASWYDAIRNESPEELDLIPLVDVQVLGGDGDDTMGLTIVDPVGLNYEGGAAVLDGGAGSDTSVEDTILIEV